MKFQTKPRQIEAIQYTAGIVGFHEMLEFLGKKLIPYYMNPASRTLTAMNDVGQYMSIHENDWVYLDSNGEINILSNKNFQDTYEAIV